MNTNLFQSEKRREPFIRLCFLLILPAVFYSPTARAVEEPPESRDAVTPPEGADVAKEASPKPDYDKIIKAVGSAVVRVEYYLQYDKLGTEPNVFGMTSANENLDRYIIEERPFEFAGYLVAPKTVVTRDMNIPPRFIKEIKVTYGENAVDAEIDAYYIDRDAVRLKMLGKLSGTKPLEFNAEEAEPYFIVNAEHVYGRWATCVRGFSLDFVFDEWLGKLFSGPDEGLVCGIGGTPVALAMGVLYPIDNGWKGSPNKWNNLSVREMKEMRERLEQAVSAAVMLVKLDFRSPSGEENPWNGGRTENMAPALRLGADKLLVLSEMNKNTTARLKKITAYTPDGKKLAAAFDKTLKDYGAFLAVLQDPPGKGLEISGADARLLYEKLKPAVKLHIRGRQLQLYYQYRRINGYAVTWKKQIAIFIPDSRSYDRSDDRKVFLFDDDLNLLALPLARREKPGSGKQSGYNRPRINYRIIKGGGSGDANMLPAARLAAILNSPDSFDETNVPVSEEKENRLAWLGVELQAMNPELARFNNVSDQTNSGRTGAIVSYIYSGSPAAKAGLEIGDILLRINMENRPEPVDISVENGKYGPYPWPSRKNALSELLTDSGTGTKFVIEYIRGGKLLSAPFVVEEGPPTFESAPKHKSEQLGMTVRNLTYEVRRYFRLGDDVSGVIVSKIKPGEPAQIASLQVLDIVMEINGQPVRNVEDFEKFVAAAEELDISIKRRTRGLVVKIHRK